MSQNGRKAVTSAIDTEVVMEYFQEECHSETKLWNGQECSKMAEKL